MNVLPNKIYSRRPKLKKTSINLCAYNNKKIPKLGKCTVIIKKIKKINTCNTHNSRHKFKTRSQFKNLQRTKSNKKNSKINCNSDSLQGLIYLLDASSGQWQIKVDEKSSQLLAFNYGRFRCNHLTEFTVLVKYSKKRWQKS